MKEPQQASYPPQSYVPMDYRGDEVDLLEVASILWGERRLIFAMTMLCALVSLTIALLQTNIYRSEALLAPAEARQSSSPLSGQLGAAASLIGINLGGEVSTKAQEAIAIMQSRDFIRRFVAKHDLLVPLMASVWDGSLGRNVVDQDIYNEASGTWLEEGGPPTDWRVHEAFSEILNVSQDSETGLVTVAIEWPDPAQAAQWVNWMVEDINAHVKAQDVEEAGNAIAYLRKQLDSTQLVEMQRVFFDLIESQTRIIMLADARDEYVFRVIDSAVAPEEKVRPLRALITVVGMLSGSLLAVIYVLTRHSIRARGMKTEGEKSRANVSIVQPVAE